MNKPKREFKKLKVQNDSNNGILNTKKGSIQSGAKIALYRDSFL